MRVLLLVDAVCARAEHFVATDFLRVENEREMDADQIEGLYCCHRTVHRVEGLLQFRHQGTWSAVRCSAVWIALYSVFQLGNLVENLDDGIRVTRVHQIHQTRWRKNATLNGCRWTQRFHKLMTFTSPPPFNDTRHVRDRVTRRSNQHKRAKVGSLRRSEHERILKESLPQRVADDVLLSNRQVYPSRFFVIPTRQLLYTLLEFETTLCSDFNIVDVLSPLQNTLHAHLSPFSSTVFSTSILTLVSIDADGIDKNETPPNSTR